MNMPRSKYDDLHDQLHPIDTKKAGTRYERLVAIVQKTLDDTAGVTHDVRLIGKDTDVKHQIDVTVTRDNQTRRVLIECKDFDVSGDPVGLGIIRDFFGVVHDTKPDEAIVITCNRFTADAMKYAKGKSIKLAVLRAHTPEDDEGTVTAVCITGNISVPLNYNATIKFVNDAGLAAFSQDDVGPGGETAMQEADRGSDAHLHRPGTDRVQLVTALNELFNDPAFADDECTDAGRWRKNITLSGCSVQRGDDPLIPINGFFIEYDLRTHVTQFEVRAPIVSLILCPIGAGADLLIYEKDLKRFQIDQATGEVQHL